MISNLTTDEQARQAEAPRVEHERPRSGRFLTNLASNLGTFGLSIIVGFWYTPYMIRNLGIANYGMIPLVTSLVSYLTLATVGFDSAVSRYLTIALARNNREEANRIFNAAFFGMATLVLALVIPSMLLTVFADHLLRIPAGQVSAVRQLLALTASVFFLRTLVSPFSVSAFCRNRFDVLGGMATIETLTRVGVVVLLFHVFTPHLMHVGLGMLASAILWVFAAVWAWRRLTPELSVSWAARDWKTLREICQMGGWVVVNQIGALLLLNVDLLVVNRLFGPEQGGRYAPLLQWSMLLRTLGGTVAGVFGPTIMGYAAREDVDGLVDYARRSVRLMNIVLAAPIGLLCGFSKPVLMLWLGPKFSPLWPLLVLMVLPLSVNLAVLPLFSINVAMNRIRIPGYVTLSLGVVNVALALLLAGPIGWGLYGVAAASAIVLTVKNALFTPYYGARVIRRPARQLYQGLAFSVTLSMSMAVAAFLAVRLCAPATWLHVGLLGSGFAAIYVVVVYWLILSAQERVACREMVGRFGVTV